MKSFFNTLQQRNPILYWYTIINLLGFIFCIIMVGFSNTMVLGINAWIKPMKFFISIAIFCASMGWYMVELQKQKAVNWYSWMLVLIFTFEHVVVVWQAANGRLSHFNISTKTDGLLFMLMGIFITILTLCTLYIGVRFFLQTAYHSSMLYIWGIRLGIILFVVFAFQGGMMASRLSHTVGAPDGGLGLPILNWSLQYGDLRIAHFFGMHSLQLLPLFGYYVARNKKQVFIVAALYTLLATLLLLIALQGKSMFNL